jgi:nucleoside phosphorylase
LYGEGVFHMKALANPKYFPETVQAVAVDKADFIFEDLFRHFGRFMPRLRFVDGGRKLQTDPPDRLPQVIFADNGAVARSLRSRGFIEPPNYPAKGLAGYPRYVLNLGDYNRPDLSAGEKKKIRDLLNAYRKAMGEERQPMVDFLEHDEQDTESLQNECFADVVVITMRQDEYDAVASRIGATTSRFCGNRTYSFGTVPGVSGKGLRLALIKTTQQGVGSAQDTARDAIEDLKPGLLMLVGIAGAVPDDEFTLGDVVVATRLHDFTVGAHVAGRPDEYTNLGGPMSKPVEDFVAALGGRKNELAGWNTSEAIGVPRPNVKLGNNLFTGSDDWKKKTRRALQRHFAKGCRAEPLFTVRPIASDGYLGKDPAVVRQWLDSARDLAAIEMELPGVYVAARRIKREVPVLAVRGISDVVGYKRSLEWTTYAANAAGSFTAAVLKILPKAWFRERTPSGQRE